MVFESLADKLQNTFKNLRGKGKLTEADVKEAMREVKLALLEADVNFKIVKDFVAKVTERAVGEEVLGSLTPGQQVVKIVNDELTALMGTTQSKLKFAPNPPTIVMLVGLQGAGKTTMCGKLGNLQKKTNSKKPLLVACDIYRPAAIKQLHVVGDSLGIPVFSMGDQVSPIEIAKAGIEHAKHYQNDLVIVDTAGRLHIDETLMDELVGIKDAIRPTEIILVVDAMTGQDAVNVAESFNEKLGIDGLILNKLDGDTRGGAALSVRAVTGKPIKFIGVGEKMDAIEEFYPDRMASRILGMGDVLSLIEKAQAAFDEDTVKKMEKKVKKGDMDLEDFLDQLQQMKKLGSFTDILKMIPGMNSKALKDVQVDDKQFVRLESIIQSMTVKERRDPSLLNASRRRRIATGSGTTVADVNKLIKQFEEMKKMMKQFSGMEKKMKRGGLGGMKFPF